MVPLIGAIASIGSSLIGAGAANAAAQAQQRAAEEAARVQRQNFLDTQEMLRPQIEAGNQARDRQLSLLGLGGDGADPTQVIRSTPGYQFAFDQGQNAVESSAAARGQLMGGKTLKDLTRFGQGFADQRYGQYFNQLGTLAGGGASATGQQVQAGQGTANNLSDLAVRSGSAQASGYTGAANAAMGGIQNLSDLYYAQNPPSWMLPKATLPKINPANGYFYG